MVRHAVDEATGHTPKKRPKNDVSDRDVVVLGSGNLGLVYLMEEKRRLTLEEIEERHPGAAARRCASTRTSAGCSCAPASTAPWRSAPAATNYLDEGRVEGATRSRRSRRPPARHLRRTDGFAHAPDVMLGSFYDQTLGRGLRVRGADLLPRRARRAADARLHPEPARSLPLPPEPVIGAAAVHGLLSGWRSTLQTGPASASPRLGAPEPAA